MSKFRVPVGPSFNKRLALEIFRNKLFSLKWRRKAPSPFAKELLQADLARQILVTVLTALQSSSTRCLHYILSQCYHKGTPDTAGDGIWRNRGKGLAEVPGSTLLAP